MQDIRMPDAVRALLRCPKCKSSLSERNGKMSCSDQQCGMQYLVINGAPVLIDEDRSVFLIEDFVLQRDTTMELQPNRLKIRIRSLLPDISMNIKAEVNYRKYTRLLMNETPEPKVLVLGGSILGKGMEALKENKSIVLIESDVSFGPRTALICDAHDIPFEDESFDGVIVQAVLEHVVDPFRCVEEIHRVLKKRGLVYAEIPFMQQVHGGRYDFTRFTLLGQRRLFRKFDEIESGATCGPGMALAWAYQYFFMSMTQSSLLRSVLRLFTRMTSFYLKYIDYYLIDKKGTLDAASGYYFIGLKSESVLSDRELIKGYRGMF
jgi:SAM-dependent methyltransferase/uncharacterized protein YbaR (Trm112 family)